MRTLTGVVIGTNVQAWDADLDAWATKTAPSGTVVGTSDTQTLTGKILTSPVINVTSDATEDIYYRSAGGVYTRLGVGATGQVLTVASGLPSWAAGGGGGVLTNWAEAVSTAAPNATVPAVSFAPDNAATDVDAVISTKGSGALLRGIPNNGTTGGNKRGVYAVDWQSLRGASNMVASGSASAIGGGISNSSSGSYSVVSGGFSNDSSGSYSSVGGGSQNVASGINSRVGGGYNNQANGTSATISGGENNSATGLSAFISGGAGNSAGGDYSEAGGAGATTRGLYGMVAHQAGRFGAQGDAQHGSYMMRGTTTGAAQTELALDGGTPAATTRIVLPNNSTYSFTGQLAARSSTGDSAGWRFTGTIKRGATAATTTLLGVTTTDTQSETGSSAWTIAVTADTTNGNLSLKVTGAAATAIRWVATVETAELTY